MLGIKLLILCLAILLIVIYLHIIIKNKENFRISDQPISTQLLDQIAIKLGISIRRIQNLAYNGDISRQLLSVSFTILNPNVIELNNGEKNANTVASIANNLFANNNFTVKINNMNIRLSKMNPSSRNIPSATVDNSVYFNNNGLKDISNYSNNKYIQVPNDPSLTQFYSLQLDNNFNLQPVLE